RAASALPSAASSPRRRTRTRSHHADRTWGTEAGRTSGSEARARALGVVEHRRQLVEHPEERRAGDGLGRLSVPAPTGLEQPVGMVAELRGRLDVATQEEHVAFREEPLV